MSTNDELGKPFLHLKSPSARLLNYSNVLIIICGLKECQLFVLIVINTAAGPVHRSVNPNSALFRTKMLNFYLVKLIYSREKILR